MSILTEKSSEILEKTTTMVEHAHGMLRQNQLNQSEYIRIKQLEARVRELHSFLKDFDGG